MKIKVNEIELFYREYGEGRPVIMLHGNGESGRLFVSAAKELSGNYRVLLPDSRNHGKSTKRVAMHYADMADDIQAFIRELQLERPIIIGFSDGGIVALLLAIRMGTELGGILAAGANVETDGLNPAFTRFCAKLWRITRSAKTLMMLREPSIPADELHSIAIPVMLTFGERDLVTRRHRQYMAECMPQAVCREYEGETHGSYITDPRKLLAVVKPYIEQL